MEPVPTHPRPAVATNAALLALLGLAALTGAVAAEELAPARFHVTGSVRVAGEYGFSHPRPVRRQYDAASFRLRQPLVADTEWLTPEGGFGALVSDAFTSQHTAFLTLPIDDLPVFAEIQSFTCRFRDSDELTDLSVDFKLQRRDRRSTEPEVLAAVSAESSGASGSLFDASDLSIDHPVVLEPFHYWISGTFRVQDATPRLAFYGCQLRYHVTQIDTR